MLIDTTSLLIWIIAAASLLGTVLVIFKSRATSVDQRIGNLPHQTVASRPSSVPRPAGRGSRRIQELAPVKMSHEQELTGRMRQAGVYGKAATAGYTTLRVGLLLVPLVIGWMVAVLGWTTPLNGLALGAIMGLAGTLAPTFWLDHRKRKRQMQVRRALPDALDVMAVCLQGGLSMTGTFARVGRELQTAHPLLSNEFQIIERQTMLGETTGEAVRDMADRFDLEELRSMASVIIQSERIGSSVAAALEVFADTLRQKRSQRAEMLAQKASIKMVFPTLFLIFPAIFIVILGPAAIQIYEVLIQGVFKR